MPVNPETVTLSPRTLLPSSGVHTGMAIQYLMTLHDEEAGDSQRQPRDLGKLSAVLKGQKNDQTFDT